MTVTVVRSDGLVLRAYTPADESALRAAFRDPLVARWNPGPADDVAGWWAGRNDWSGGEHASWAVAAEDDDRLLGSVSLHQIHLDQAACEIGYFTVPAERGRGVSSRSVGLAARYGFQVLGLHRVQLFHAVGNVASCHVALAAGFAVEGTLRESYRYGDGAWYDEHLHGLLATDPPRYPADHG